MSDHSRLEEEWCGELKEGTTAFIWRQQAHEYKGHPLRGHHFILTPTSRFCWYCGKK